MKILEFIPKHWREQATGVTEGFVLALAKPLQTAWDIRKRLDLWLSPENMDSSTLDFWLYFLGLPPSVILVLNQGQKISLLPNLVNTWVSKGSVEGVELYAKAIFGPSIVFSEDAFLFIVGVSKAGDLVGTLRPLWNYKLLIPLAVPQTDAEVRQIMAYSVPMFCRYTIERV